MIRRFQVSAGWRPKNFYFRADGALVITEALQIEFEPVVFVAALVARKTAGAVILRDQKIGRAVAIVVAGDNGAGR